MDGANFGVKEGFSRDESLFSSDKRILRAAFLGATRDSSSLERQLVLSRKPPTQNLDTLACQMLPNAGHRSAALALGMLLVSWSPELRGEDPQEYREPSDIENVDVYRGHAPARLEVPAIGGAIVLTPRRESQSSALLNAELGSFGMLGVSGSRPSCCSAKPPSTTH